MATIAREKFRRMWVGSWVPCSRRRRELPVIILFLFITMTLLLPRSLLPETRQKQLRLLHEDLARGSGRSHVDVSGRYKVLPFAALGADWPPSGDEDVVCLATHTTVGSARGEEMVLMETLSSWAGPASIALYDSDPSLEHAFRFLRRLEACGHHPALAQVSFHVIGPNNKSEDGTPAPTTPEAGSGAEEDAWEEWCRGEDGSAMVRLREAAGGNKTQLKEMLYPQNLARNTALRRCPPLSWVMTVDSDMVPPASLRRRLGRFLGRLEAEPHRQPRRSFVVPTYEVVRRHNGSSEDTPLPETKASLMRLKRAGEARPFHYSVFKSNQHASNLAKWEARNASGDSDNISVSHEVRSFPFWYEPVYVTRLSADLPPFEERFVGFGMTRNTQAYEMSLLGYTFEVLDNAFLVHWGFQELKQRPKWREKQSQRNLNFFKKWILEKAVQYDVDSANLIKMAGNQNGRKVVVQLRSSMHKATSTTKVVPTSRNGTKVQEQRVDVHHSTNDTAGVRSTKAPAAAD